MDKGLGPLRVTSRQNATARLSVRVVMAFQVIPQKTRIRRPQPKSCRGHQEIPEVTEFLIMKAPSKSVGSPGNITDDWNDHSHSHHHVQDDHDHDSHGHNHQTGIAEYKAGPDEYHCRRQPDRLVASIHGP